MILSEKLFASDVFKGKKSLYEQSVAQPFVGDHIRIASNPQWKNNDNQEKVLFSSDGLKVHRKSGKAVPCLVVVTSKSFNIVDPKSFKAKLTISLGDLVSLSFSPFNDGTVVVSSNPATNGKKSKTKGDLIITSDHCIELATKISMYTKRHHGKHVNCIVANKIILKLDKETEMTFSKVISTIDVGAPLIKKVKNSFVVTVLAAKDHSEQRDDVKL